MCSNWWHWGSYSEPRLRGVGVNLSIYPGKGYSATFKILRPELTPQVSTIDDEVKCAMLVQRVEEVLPGVCDTRLESEGGTPNFWTGLRPATPTNIP